MNNLYCLPYRLASLDPSHTGRSSSAAVGPLPLTLPRVAWVWEATQLIQTVKYTYVRPNDIGRNFWSSDGYRYTGIERTE